MMLAEIVLGYPFQPVTAIGGTVKKYSAALLAAALVAASMLLAGCGGDSEAGASPQGTTGSPPTAATPAPTTTSALPKTAAPKVAPKADPDIPAAARAHTPDGAAAFVKHFYSQLNVAWGEPKAGLLAPLSLPGCKTCRTLEDTSAKMVADRERMIGDTARVDFADPGYLESNGDQTVVVTGAQLKTSVVDLSGKPVQDIPADRIRDLATTRWVASGWRVSEIKVLK